MSKMKSMIKRIVSTRQLYHCRTVTYKHADEQGYGNARNSEGNKFNKHAKYVAVGAGLAAAIAYGYNEFRKNHVLLKRAEVDAGNFKKQLPSYTLDEVSKHSTIEDGVWITYKQGVYDITNFVSEHPGGDQIMLAAGSSVEPFWLLYAVHKTDEIFAMLESMRIGNLSAEEAEVAVKDMMDPYFNDPKRHKVLRPSSDKPYNAEPPPFLLVDNFVTPNELFYVRNHLPVPEIDPTTYELEIEVEGTTKTKTLTLAELKKFPKHTIMASIMCAGNRRSELNKVKQVKGLDWGYAAIGNAMWTGVRLRDVLKLVGIDEDTEGYKHIQFEGLDTDPTNTPYGASIPFLKALNKPGDVILAYEMNGQPIPRDHGFPVRVIVPGVVGARNVKWLGRIIVSTQESDSHWQQRDYKGFSPSTDWDTVDWTSAPAIQELPVTSAICKPSPGDIVKVENGFITVRGYAWAGGGQKIIRVDVTADGGNTWYDASIDSQDSNVPPQHWGWSLWTAKIPVSAEMKEVEIWAKAVDSTYNSQPEDCKNIWNLRGVLNNAYHRVKVNLKW